MKGLRQRRRRIVALTLGWFLVLLAACSTLLWFSGDPFPNAIGIGRDPKVIFFVYNGNLALVTTPLSPNMRSSYIGIVPASIGRKIAFDIPDSNRHGYAFIFPLLFIIALSAACGAWLLSEARSPQPAEWRRDRNPDQQADSRGDEPLFKD